MMILTVAMCSKWTDEWLVAGLGICWSPDGSKIAFMLNGAIAVVNPDGRIQQYLTDNSGANYSPNWSHKATPNVKTNDPSNLSFNSGILNGTLRGLGITMNVSVNFDWGTDTNYTGGKKPR